ncbi:hypothetical protein DAPPUDRAFT_252687 [Daphnia pulex]|uniref:Uncharacterized protein n=1 Tax=Daphnia pulex TaxID=6669 RepID=E9H397_DAPPU|nr:hypothetical protein DAPPUDRAFT_252687 [Daphnia pulex]|eukprot:EFX73723.1 hypothetical protein DAPPUDRAFT_252687 [Daphnia pulex]
MELKASSVGLYCRYTIMAIEMSPEVFVPQPAGSQSLDNSWNLADGRKLDQKF